jgi:hypothetical protein
VLISSFRLESNCNLTELIIQLNFVSISSFKLESNCNLTELIIQLNFVLISSIHNKNLIVSGNNLHEGLLQISTVFVVPHLHFHGSHTLEAIGFELKIGRC